MYAFSAYSADTPHLYLDVDRVKASLMDVDINTIFSTLQNYFGSRYVNDVNFEGQVNKVIVQADWDFRKNTDVMNRIHIKSRTGNMVPLGSVVTIEKNTRTKNYRNDTISLPLRLSQRCRCRL